MTDRELMQDVLEAMETAIKSGDWKVDGACDPEAVLVRLRNRLAQPDPVRWERRPDGKVGLTNEPPKREWVGLTDEERHQISLDNRPYCANIMRAHEEELKRRNT